MSKLIITRGLPASGKTTWAKDWLAQAPHDRARVNRDDLRAMLHAGFVRELERQVTAIQHSIVRDRLLAGKDVVVDDTNLRLSVAKAFHKLAHEVGASFEVNDEFLGVSAIECVERDRKRDGLARVGAKVILGMHDRYRPDRGLAYPELTNPSDYAAEPYVPVDGAPEAILVDLDGTLALMGERGAFDWERVGEDEVNQPVLAAIWDAIMAHGHKPVHVIFMSGRDERCRKQTLRWLHQKTGLVVDPSSFDTDYRFDHRRELFMRPAGDTRQDAVVKLELFNQHIRHIYNVRHVFDDRNQVVEMWRKLGLTVFQVAEGSF